MKTAPQYLSKTAFVKGNKEDSTQINTRNKSVAEFHSAWRSDTDFNDRQEWKQGE